MESQQHTAATTRQKKSEAVPPRPGLAPARQKERLASRARRTQTKTPEHGAERRRRRSDRVSAGRFSHPIILENSSTYYLFHLFIYFISVRFVTLNRQIKWLINCVIKLNTY